MFAKLSLVGVLPCLAMSKQIHMERMRFGTKKKKELTSQVRFLEALVLLFSAEKA